MRRGRSRSGPVRAARVAIAGPNPVKTTAEGGADRVIKQKTQGSSSVPGFFFGLVNSTRDDVAKMMGNIRNVANMTTRRWTPIKPDVAAPGMVERLGITVDERR